MFIFQINQQRFFLAAPRDMKTLPVFIILFPIPNDNVSFQLRSHGLDQKSITVKILFCSLKQILIKILSCSSNSTSVVGLFLRVNRVLGDFLDGHDPQPGSFTDEAFTLNRFSLVPYQTVGTGLEHAIPRASKVKDFTILNFFLKHFIRRYMFVVFTSW